MSSSKLDACCRKAFTAVEGLLSCSSKSGTCAKPSAFMYFHEGVDVPLGKCRGVTPSVAQAFVADDVVLKVFHANQRSKLLFIRGLLSVSIWSDILATDRQKKLQHVKLVTVCSYTKEIIKFF